jgi:hypothetical protein
MMWKQWRRGTTRLRTSKARPLSAPQCCMIARAAGFESPLGCYRLGLHGPLRISYISTLRQRTRFLSRLVKRQPSPVRTECGEGARLDSRIIGKMHLYDKILLLVNIGKLEICGMPRGGRRSIGGVNRQKISEREVEAFGKLWVACFWLHPIAAGRCCGVVVVCW